MNWMAILIIALALGVIIGNIMLLKHASKLSMKNINRDPLEDAKSRLKERENDQSKS